MKSLRLMLCAMPLVLTGCSTLSSVKLVRRISVELVWFFDGSHRAGGGTTHCCDAAG